MVRCRQAKVLQSNLSGNENDGLVNKKMRLFVSQSDCDGLITMLLRPAPSSIITQLLVDFSSTNPKSGASIPSSVMCP